MNRWLGLAFLVIVAGACALRCPELALRPMHNDEAVNAEKIKGLWQSGRYTYDPNEHHGPTLLYATLPFVLASGAPDYPHLSEGTLRTVSVFFGIALILSVWLLADGLGATAVVSASLLTALSPAMVFYSRYFIHEMLLVWSSLLVIAGGWRYSRRPAAGWAVFAGAGVGFMYATKETFVIALAAMAGALLVTRFLDRRTLPPSLRPNFVWNRTHLAIAVLAAAFVALVFFTSFFTNARGPLDSLRTYIPWLKRAGGASPHLHPWYFYLERLFYFKPPRSPLWSEGLIGVLALVGAAAAWTRGSLPPATSQPLVRFLALYTFFLTAAYSVISYKTPWCLLGFLHPMILLAGVGLTALLTLGRRRWVQGAVLAVGLAATAQLGTQAWRASFRFPADPRNPYVYAQTLPDLNRLADEVIALGQAHADGTNMLIKVMAPESDYWPLPWSLRQFNRIGWWDRIPADPFAPVMIVGADWRAALDDRSEKKWLMVGYFELRPKTFLELYVQYELWEKYLQTRPRPAEE